MESVGMACIKYLLFCFNLIFAISGIAIITVGAVVQASYYDYTEFVDSSYVSAPLVLIIVGVIVFIVAFFGCCGAIREKHCMIMTFAVFLLVIFTLEIAVGIAGYVRHGEVQSMLENNLEKSMDKYTSDVSIQRSWNSAQHDLKCCGINGTSDWEHVFKNTTLPYTCCENTSKVDHCTENSPNVYQEGCLHKLKDIFEKNAYVIGGVGIGVALIELFGVVLACLLGRSIKREYETV